MRFATLFLRVLASALVCGAAESWAATHLVDVLDDEFEPKFLQIAPGDTVIWTNVGGSAHTVTQNDGYFDTGTAMPADSTFSFTFPEANRFPYYCTLHGASMSGVIRVVDSSTNLPPAAPVNATPANGTVDLSTGPTLTAGTFSDPNAEDSHRASQWIVTEVPSGTTVLDTGESTDELTSLQLTGLKEGTTYGWKVRYFDDVNGASPYSTETRFTTVAAPSSGGTGLTTTYGNYVLKSNKFTPRATGLVSPAINYDWKLGKPHKSTSANNFLVRWEGSVIPTLSERYLFRLRADGGVRLWINEQLIIDDWFSPPFPVFRSNFFTMQAGVPCRIKLEYFDAAGKSSVALSWSSRSLPTEIIPMAKLYPLAP